jgi:hypothetical protein
LVGVQHDSRNLASVTPAQHRQGHGSPMTIPLHSEKLLQKSSVIQRSNFSDIEGTPASFLGPLLYLGCFTEKAHPSSHLLQISPLPPRKRLVTAPPSSSCISLPLHSPTLLLQGSCPKTTHFPVFALSTFYLLVPQHGQGSLATSFRPLSLWSSSQKTKTMHEGDHRLSCSIASLPGRFNSSSCFATLQSHGSIPFSHPTLRGSLPLHPSPNKSYDIWGRPQLALSASFFNPSALSS